MIGGRQHPLAQAGADVQAPTSRALPADTHQTGGVDTVSGEA